jgi:hypothetical protein
MVSNGSSNEKRTDIRRNPLLVLKKVSFFRKSRNTPAKSERLIPDSSK